MTPSAKVVKGYEPIMPTYQGQLTEEGLLQLISYIKTLAQAKPAAAPSTAAPKAAAEAAVPVRAAAGS